MKLLQLESLFLLIKKKTLISEHVQNVQKNLGHKNIQDKFKLQGNDSFFLIYERGFLFMYPK